MREIRMSGSMRGGRKRAFARRACLLLCRVPKLSNATFSDLRLFGQIWKVSSFSKFERFT
jgi:hypothetical protein